MLKWKMGEAAAALQEDVLSHMEKLEACSHKAALKRGEVKKHEEYVALMKSKIKELKRQRDELKSKLNISRSLLAGSKEATQSDPQNSQVTEASQQALLEWKMENAKGLLHVFHLTGLSGKQTKQGACLCLTTAFEGTYLASYYLDILIQKPIQIQRHSIPAFIPLEQIAHQHLQTDMQRFLSELSDHLNAYAGRKFQADQLQERFSPFLEGSLRGNSLCNLLEFNYGVIREARTFPFTARLIYGDPVSVLPTEATVVCKVEDPPASSTGEEVEAHLALFRKKPLHEVFSAIAASTQTLSQSVS